MDVWRQLSIFSFLSRFPFHPFHLFSKTDNSFAGIEKFYHPLNADCNTELANTIEFQNLTIVLVTEVGEFRKKIFSFGRVVKVKTNIHKQLFNTKAVDLCECIRGLFWGILGDRTRASRQNNIVILLPCFPYQWITNVYRGVAHTYWDTLIPQKPCFDWEASMAPKMALHWILWTYLYQEIWLMSKIYTVEGSFLEPLTLAAIGGNAKASASRLVNLCFLKLFLAQVYAFAILNLEKCSWIMVLKQSAVTNDRLCSARKPVTSP